MPKIVIIGHVCIDHNTTEDATYTGWGSSVLYIADYLQRTQGVRPTAISTYGPDMLEHLPDVRLLPKQPTESKTLLYENDTRALPRIWKAHQTEYSHPPELTPEVIAAVHDADILIVATLLPDYPAAYIKELLGHAKPSTLTMLCPQGYLRQIGDGGLVRPRDFEEGAEIVPLFNLTVFSVEDNPRAFELARGWLRDAPNAETKIIVTQGEKGATIFGQDAEQYVPTTPLTPDQIVDSVGCGDVFEAMLCYTYWQTHDLEAAVKAAHKAAAQKLLAIPSAPAKQLSGSDNVSG